MIIISFTDNGSRQNAILNKTLTENGITCISYAVKRFAIQYGLNPLPDDKRSWIGGQWGKSEFLFIGAAGIAVRYIAPWVKDKFSDSPVVVMDEKGEYVIPLLSGHMGGAVEIARRIAAFTGAKPVITTATDVQDKFAVDVFAKKNGLSIESRRLAKEISAAVLEHKKIGFYSGLPAKAELPEELTWCSKPDALNEFPYGIEVGERKHTDSENVLWLRSYPEIIVGIGCRRGTVKQRLKAGLEKALELNGVLEKQIVAFASIDLKKDEKGLLELSEELGIPFKTFTAQELSQIDTVSSSSAFVAQTTGVDNVCERAARYYCREGELLQPKICLEGCTYALVKKKKVLFFEPSMAKETTDERGVK